jgi:antitoxin component YwqK of YwqJK toxin-antitoxin module
MHNELIGAFLLRTAITMSESAEACGTIAILFLVYAVSIAGSYHWALYNNPCSPPKLCECQLNISESNQKITYFEGYWYNNRYEPSDIVSAIISLKDGVPHGLVQRFHKSSERLLAEESDFVDGLCQGKVRKWRPFGSLESKCDYVDDKKHGMCYDYHINGNLERKIPYVNGNKHGETIEYHDDGSLRLRANYNHGVRNGRFEEWYPDGLVKSSCNFLDGLLHGSCEKYSLDGLITSKISYDHGTPYIIVSEK